MKKGRFLWSAHRITEKQKAGKARNIKEKQLKNSRNTASKPLVALRSSASDNHCPIHRILSDVGFKIYSYRMRDNLMTTTLSEISGRVLCYLGVIFLTFGLFYSIIN